MLCLSGFLMSGGGWGGRVRLGGVGVSYAWGVEMK